MIMRRCIFLCSRSKCGRRFEFSDGRKNAQTASSFAPHLKSILAGSILHLQTGGIRVDQEEMPADCRGQQSRRDSCRGCNEPAQVVYKTFSDMHLYVSEPFSNCSIQSSQPDLLLWYHPKKPEENAKAAR